MWDMNTGEGMVNLYVVHNKAQTSKKYTQIKGFVAKLSILSRMNPFILFWSNLNLGLILTLRNVLINYFAKINKKTIPNNCVKGIPWKKDGWRNKNEI
jgi:hypothetical protein